MAMKLCWFLLMFVVIRVELGDIERYSARYSSSSTWIGP